MVGHNDAINRVTTGEDTPRSLVLMDIQISALKRDVGAREWESSPLIQVKMAHVQPM